MSAKIYLVEDGYAIKGADPPGLRKQPAPIKQIFYGWIMEAGLKAKDRDLARGLDKDGKPLRRITAATRKHRKSAMTPTGEGDPLAPPLTPGRQLSRVRSLLTGRAFPDHAEFWWKFDPFTGDSFAKVLERQKDRGRNVFGLSPAALKRVVAQAWEKYAKWEAGKAVEMPGVIGVPQARPIAAVGSAIGPSATMGINAPASLGQFSGGMRVEDWVKHFRQPAAVTIPGRPKGPYNRLLGHIWGQPPPPAKPVIPPAKPVIPPAPRFRTEADLHAWGKAVLPNATITPDGIPLDVWGHIAGEIGRLAEDYPQVAAGIRYLNLPEGNDGNFIAAADWEGRYLRFNPRYWADQAAIEAVRVRGVANGFFPPGTSDPAANVTHEWGHLFDGYLRYRGTTEERELSFLVRKLFQADGRFDAIKGAAVSQYGATNEDEAIAEAFTVMRWRPPALWPEAVRRLAEIVGYTP